ncbi:MAG: radical SAM protein [Kiritimatiellia bacterium]
MTKTIQVCETFSSIQGETTFAGRPCFFIRLAGCNLRCRYCDSQYAWRPGRRRTVASLVREFRRSGLSLAEVTGGEPLCQCATFRLLAALCKHGMTLLETNGSLDISRVPKAVRILMDIKTPGSGQAASNEWRNLELLGRKDEVKFVICGREDYEWAREVIASNRLTKRCGAVNLGPAAGLLAPPTLARWILKDRLPVRINLQLHNIIWPGAVRGK